MLLWAARTISESARVLLGDGRIALFLTLDILTLLSAKIHRNVYSIYIFAGLITALNWLSTVLVAKKHTRHLLTGSSLSISATLVLNFTLVIV